MTVTRLMKRNCWDRSRCGRERGGRNEKELGVCPAAAEERLNSVHDGINRGEPAGQLLRYSAIVLGTIFFS